jgi:hypothetical protein
VELTHPFGVPNLTGFDVRGIAIFDASHAFPATALTLSDRDLGDGQILNADGYTTLYNMTTAGSGPKGFQGYIEGDLATHQVPNGLLDAYKRYITDDPSNTRNAFFAGDSIELTYEVDMPDGPFVFGYAVDACWEPPVTKPVTDPMTDFGPEANCPEPWFIDVDVEPLGPGLTEMGGEVRMIIDVYELPGIDQSLGSGRRMPGDPGCRHHPGIGLDLGRRRLFEIRGVCVEYAACTARRISLPCPCGR